MAHNSVEIARTGQQQERVVIAFLVLSWIFILLRIWTRIYVISNFGWDDSTMILAGMVFTVYCAALLYIEANGGGTHITNIAHLQLLTKWVVVSEVTYLMTMMILKISLAIFFARIIVKPWQFGLIYVTVGINIFSSAAAFFYCLFRCGPNIDDYVKRQIADLCTPRSLDNFMAYQQAAFTTLTDVFFFFLPIIVLWNANMDRKSKLSVGFILCLAALGCICSMIRFRYVEGLTQIEDFFWNAVNIAIWSTIEAGACIIAGCLATLRPLLKRAFNQARGSSSLSGCVKQISRSLRSASQSDPSSQDSSIPRYNTPTSATIFRDKRRDRADQRTDEGEGEGEEEGEDPTFLEFIAPPGRDVIQLTSSTSPERKSTDLIFAGFEEPTLEFNWPVEQNSGSRKGKEKRHAKHASWALPGIADEERTFQRPVSAPLPALVLGRRGGERGERSFLV